jgi:Tfp pilus assembly protein FimT
MLVVLVIMSILSVLIAVSFSSILTSSYDSELVNFQSLLTRARAYAVANNSYVFVGIQEIDSTVASNTTPQTPLLNGGAIMVAVITTSDGSRGYDPTATKLSATTTPPNVGSATTVPDPTYLNSSSGTGSNTLVAATPVIVTPIERFDNLHIIACSSGQNNSLVFPNNTPLQQTSLPTVGRVLNLGNPSSGASSLTFSWPPGSAASAAKYTFSEVIQFNPQGEAQVINGPNVDGLLQYIELDLETMHGKALPNPQSPNNAAIVIDGVSGSVRIFRT